MLLVFGRLYRPTRNGSISRNLGSSGIETEIKTEDEFSAIACQSLALTPSTGRQFHTLSDQNQLNWLKS
jgi:hypothetical protein